MRPLIRVYRLRKYNRGVFWTHPTNPKTKTAVMINLETTITRRHHKTGVAHPIAPHFVTERQFVLFLYQTFGDGRYVITAYNKGRREPYIFWKGEVNSNGYMFYKQEYNKKSVGKYQRKLDKLNYDYSNNRIGEDEFKQLRAEVMDDISFETEFAKDMVKLDRYGFTPYLKPSGRRGEFHGWEEEDLGFANVKIGGEPKRMGVPRKSRDVSNLSVSELNDY
jgi:hypothetical protein